MPVNLPLLMALVSSSRDRSRSPSFDDGDVQYVRAATAPVHRLRLTPRRKTPTGAPTDARRETPSEEAPTETQTELLLNRLKALQQPKCKAPTEATEAPTKAQPKTRPRKSAMKHARDRVKVISTASSHQFYKPGPIIKPGPMEPGPIYYKPDSEIIKPGPMKPGPIYYKPDPVPGPIIYYKPDPMGRAEICDETPTEAPTATPTEAPNERPHGWYIRNYLKAPEAPPELNSGKLEPSHPASEFWIVPEQPSYPPPWYCFPGCHKLAPYR